MSTDTTSPERIVAADPSSKLTIIKSPLTLPPSLTGTGPPPQTNKDNIALQVKGSTSCSQDLDRPDPQTEAPPGNSLRGMKDIARALHETKGPAEAAAVFRARCKEIEKGIEHAELAGILIGVARGLVCLGAFVAAFWLYKKASPLAGLGIALAGANAALVMAYGNLHYTNVRQPELRAERRAVGQLEAAFLKHPEHARRAAQAIFDREASNQDVLELLNSVELVLSTQHYLECTKNESKGLGEASCRGRGVTLAAKIVAAFHRAFGSVEDRASGVCYKLADIVAGKVTRPNAVSAALDAHVEAVVPALHTEVARLLSDAFDTNDEDVPGAIAEAQDTLREQWKGPVADRLVDEIGEGVLEQALITATANVTDDMPETPEVGPRLDHSQWLGLTNSTNPECKRSLERARAATAQLHANTTLMKATQPQNTLDSRRRRWEANGKYSAALITIVAFQVCLVLGLLSWLFPKHTVLLVCGLVAVGVLSTGAAMLLGAYTYKKTTQLEQESDNVVKQYNTLLINLEHVQKTLSSPDVTEQAYTQFLKAWDTVAWQLKGCGLHSVEDATRQLAPPPWHSIVLKATILLVALLVLAYLWNLTRGQLSLVGTLDTGAFVKPPPLPVLLTAAACIVCALFVVDTITDMYTHLSRFKPKSCG